MSHMSRLTKCILANYRYEKDKAVATYLQDQGPYLEANHRARENERGPFERYDLDMGFKFASIPKVEWLKIQQMGIDQDPAAIMRYVEINNHYKTTKKRLI